MQAGELRGRVATVGDADYVAVLLPEPRGADSDLALIHDFSPRSMLRVELCATLSSDTAAIGDVVVPTAADAEGITTPTSAPEILTAARQLAHEPWHLEIGLPRPARQDEIPRVRFGDVSASDHIVGSNAAAVRAAGLAVIEMESAGFRDIRGAPHGLVLGVADDASPEKQDRWSSYVARGVAVFATRLALRLDEQQTSVAALEPPFPYLDLAAGTRLFRVHHANFPPLQGWKAPGDPSGLIHFSLCSPAALASVVAPGGSMDPALTRSQLASLTLTEFVVDSPLRLADLTGPRARALGFASLPATRLDRERIALLVEADLDGWSYPSLLSADPQWDTAVLITPQSALPSVLSRHKVADFPWDVSPSDPLAALLSDASSKD